MRISLSLLSLAALGCTYNRSTKIGECPDGFIQDAEGNCVESDSDDPTDPDPSTDDTGDTDEPCEVALDDAEPGDGDEQVYWQDDLLFWLDGPDECRT